MKVSVLHCGVVDLDEMKAILSQPLVVSRLGDAPDSYDPWYRYLVGLSFREWRDTETGQAGGERVYRGLRVRLSLSGEDVSRLVSHGISVMNPRDLYSEHEAGEIAVSRALHCLCRGISGPRRQRVETAVWAAWEQHRGPSGGFGFDILPLSHKSYKVEVK